MAEREDGKSEKAIDVTISIVNWNRADLLRECLASVASSRLDMTCETIVVDNGSTDESVEMLRRHFSWARLIANESNRGFGRAHNQVLAIAAGRYFLALNNDARVEIDTIQRLVEFMERHPEASVSTCPDRRQKRMTTFHAGGVAQYPTLARTLLENLWCVFRPPFLPDPGLWKLPWQHGSRLPPPHQPAEVAWVVGALIMARTAVLRRVEGFDEGFFLFAEELDLCRRIRDDGGRIFFTSSAAYEHLGGGSSELLDDIERVRGESGRRYFLKHHGVGAARAFVLQHTVLRRGMLRARQRAEGWIWRLISARATPKAGQ